MPSVELSEQEWGQLMNLISTAPWRDANPLLMKIGEQLRREALNRPTNPPDGVRVPTNGQEARNE